MVEPTTVVLAAIPHVIKLAKNIQREPVTALRDALSAFQDLQDAPNDEGPLREARSRFHSRFHTAEGEETGYYKALATDGLNVA